MKHHIAHPFILHCFSLFYFLLANTYNLWKVNFAIIYAGMYMILWDRNPICKLHECMLIYARDVSLRYERHGKRYAHCNKIGERTLLRK